MLRTRLAARCAPNIIAKRSMAMAAAVAPVHTQITKLTNGITVATEHDPSATASSIGLVFGSGSTAENPYNNGVSNLSTHLFSKNNNLTKLANENDFQLNSHVARDYQSYMVSSLPGQQGKVFQFLQKNLIEAKLDEPTFNYEKQLCEQQTAIFENTQHATRVMEHLHSTAFQNTPLSLPTRGTVETLQTLTTSDLQYFTQNNFKASNAVVVGTGNIPHEELLQAVEDNLQLAPGEKQVSKTKSTFLGSEVRLRDDTLPKAWISIAVEGEPMNSPNYYTAQVAAQIFGQYNAFEPRSRLQGIKLLDNLQEYGLCDSFDHFNLSYKDSGLWGFSTVTRNVGSIDDLIHFTLKQWNRLTISITNTELARGKSLLKLKLANENSNNVSNLQRANLLGESIVNTGTKHNLQEIFNKIDSITVKDIKAWAGERVWDQDIAIAGTGQIEGLLDYMRIRNDMSMMRW